MQGDRTEECRCRREPQSLVYVLRGRGAKFSTKTTNARIFTLLQRNTTMQRTPQAAPTNAQNVSNVPMVPSTAAPSPTVASSRDALRLLPDHVLTTKVFTYFGFKDYALASCASQYLQAHWQTANRKKPMPLYVPEDCKTLKEAVKWVHEYDCLTTIVNMA